MSQFTLICVIAPQLPGILARLLKDGATIVAVVMEPRDSLINLRYTVVYQHTEEISVETRT